MSSMIEAGASSNHHNVDMLLKESLLWVVLPGEIGDSDGRFRAQKAVSNRNHNGGSKSTAYDE
jgi:hypothetical protein